MHNKSEIFKQFFKKIILEQFEKIDKNNANSRNDIYVIAFRTLRNKHNSEKSFSASLKNLQSVALQAAVNEIEIKYSTLTRKIFSKRFLSVITNKKFSNNKIASEKLIFLKKNKYYAILIFLALVFFVYFLLHQTFKTSLGIITQTPTPLVIFADNMLLKSLRVRGEGEVSLIKNSIKYEAIHGNKKKSNSLDIVFDDDITKKIREITKPSVITFQIQNKSETELQIQLSIFGLGKAVIKELQVFDPGINELFLITSELPPRKKIENVIIRIKLNDGNTENQIKSSVLLKKIEFKEL